jgi:hypothetical protein
MGGGEAGVELDRLLERRDRAIGSARPHAYQAEREAGVRVTGGDIDCALRQLE